MVTGFVVNSPAPIYNGARVIQNLFDCRKINKAVRQGTPLVLIYQYGRVASTSVYASVLAANLDMPVYHVHTLSSARAVEWIDRARRNGRRIDRNFVLGKLLGEVISKIGDGSYPKPWKIISIFREPISVFVSLHFLNPKGQFVEVLEKYCEGNKSPVIDYFQTLFDRDDPSGWLLSNWYDEVFGEETGVNVYDHRFDVDQGYQIIKDDRFEILLLRFEDLSNGFKQGAAQLFGLGEDRFNLIHSHLHKNDKYHEIHEYVKNNLKLSRETCNKIYSTKFIKHFYSDDLIDRLTAKWSTNS
ncbi:Protein of unknown function NKWYS [Desulfurivibrio alkaliphilus AHT 2]|uniref:Sulfotransferase domain-containing protein n=2 Tax=Desulfurivibrio alkaliphilus TaxID=427923 RepID=D6Z4J0_DESAT|nr:Protein of unknown function NKWYS [Desulfurivibrio alkaliphilus AHT 2]